MKLMARHECNAQAGQSESPTPRLEGRDFGGGVDKERRGEVAFTVRDRTRIQLEEY